MLLLLIFLLLCQRAVQSTGLCVTRREEPCRSAVCARWGVSERPGPLGALRGRRQQLPEPAGRRSRAAGRELRERHGQGVPQHLPDGGVGPRGRRGPRRLRQPRRLHGPTPDQLPEIRAQECRVELPPRRQRQQRIHGGEPVLRMPGPEPVRHAEVHGLARLAAGLGEVRKDGGGAPVVVHGGGGQVPHEADGDQLALLGEQSQPVLSYLVAPVVAVPTLADHAGRAAQRPEPGGEVLLQMREFPELDQDAGPGGPPGQFGDTGQGRAPGDDAGARPCFEGTGVTGRPGPAAVSA